MKKTIAIIIAAIFVLQIVSALTLTDVSTNPKEVEPGKKVRVTLTVKNDLDDNIENVGVGLNLAGIPIAPEKSSVVYTDKIKEDDEEDFTFDLIADADADAKVYTIPVYISYRVEDTNQTINIPLSSVSISVNAKPVLSLNADGFLLFGQKSKVSIKITNSGLAKAKFLEVKAGEGPYKLLSTNKIYIGDLSSNDFDSFSFDIYPNSKGVLSIPITIKYKDAANNDYTETQNVDIRVYSQEEALQLGLTTQSNIGIYVIVVIVLIVLWIVYSRLRKWLRNKKARANSGGK